MLTTVAVGLVLFVGPVAADIKAVRDPDDTSGRLDVKVLSHRHARQGRVLIHRLGTYHNWRSRRLRAPRNYIILWFSTDKEDRHAEKLVIIDFQDGELRGLTACDDSFNVSPAERG